MSTIPSGLREHLAALGRAVVIADVDDASPPARGPAMNGDEHDVTEAGQLAIGIPGEQRPIPGLAAEPPPHPDPLPRLPGVDPERETETER